MAVPQPTLCHSWGKSLTNPMLIFVFYNQCFLQFWPKGHWEHCNKVWSLSWGECLWGFNPIQDGLFWGCPWMGGKEATLPKICHTSYSGETWHSYALPKEDQQIIWIMWHTHPLSSADVSIFSVEIAKFCYIRKYRYGFHFDAYLLTFSVFLGL